MKEERKVQYQILQGLLEVDRTLYHLQVGCKDIYEFCMKKLGYSEGAACRRVNAMRLMRGDQSVAAKIQSGELTLTNAARVQTVIQKARKQKVKVPKQELVQAALGASTRDAEAKIYVTAMNHGLEIKNERAALKDKIANLRPLLPNSQQAMTDEEILALALEELTAKLEKSLTKGDLAKEVKKPAARHVPEKLRSALFVRHQSRCCHTDPVTKARCPATHFLEVDHIIPVAHGGLTVEKNLQLLCRAHNQRKGARVTPSDGGSPGLFR